MIGKILVLVNNLEILVNISQLFKHQNRTNESDPGHQMELAMDFESLPVKAMNDLLDGLLLKYKYDAGTTAALLAIRGHHLPHLTDGCREIVAHMRQRIDSPAVTPAKRKGRHAH